ncbi:nucleocapsid [Hymenopteran rhabdo-related virus]|uniref:Nucleoprotein n=1 Tax=Hymenopteran rhabdo-related virus 46 TaxID=2847807 RepID=A0AAE9H2L5_9RHAB|nr:nucleocapsid [Hymenopteran rhabdo-related virus]UOS86045.1 nucleocapsid [Hymenopteran rhabdo-related virus 46]
MSSRLENSAQDLGEVIATALPHLPKATAPSLAGWSDDLLAKLAADIRFPNYVKNRGMLKKVLARFYDFYFSGTIRAGDTLVATVFDAIAISETESGPIWSDHHVSPTGFYVANTSQEENLTVQDTGAIPTVEYADPKWSEEARKKYDALMTEYTLENSNQFRNNIQRILTNIRSDGHSTEPEKALVRLSGFLALTLCRSAIKSALQMGNSFLKKQYRANLATVAFWPIESAFTPPCTACLKACELGLKKGLAPTSKIFTLLAHEFVVSRESGYENQSAPGYMSAAVLTHTARNGLGLIGLIEQASDITGFSWKDMLEMTFYNKTETSWRTVAHFFATYLNVRGTQAGYNWARVINHGYLRGLAPKENPFLACIMAAVIENIQGTGIWEAEWAKLYAKDMEDAKNLGRALYLESRPTLDRLESTAKSRKLIALAQTIKDSRATNGDDADLENMTWN